MPMVRVGSVSFLNARPLVWGLAESAGVELGLDVPSRLAGDLSEGRFDVALLPTIDYQRIPGLRLLARHSAGLIGLSSCLKGDVADLQSKGLSEAAESAARELASYFEPGSFYIEIMDHGLPEQKETNPLLIDLARRTGLPLAATNDVHYLNKEDAESHEVLLCIQTNKKLSDQDRMRFGSQEFYFKSRDEMAALFPEAPESLETTAHIAAMCDFEIPLAGHFLPSFKPPDGLNLQEYFERVAGEGFA